MLIEIFFTNSVACNFGLGNINNLFFYPIYGKFLFDHYLTTKFIAYVETYFLRHYNSNTLIDASWS